jgi:hypothetical protein
MKKLIFAVIVLVVGYFGLVKADEKTYTPQETIQAFAGVPGKVAGHISSEFDKTKAYQKANWEEVKFKWNGFKEKFLSN